MIVTLTDKQIQTVTSLINEAHTEGYEAGFKKGYEIGFKDGYEASLGTIPVDTKDTEILYPIHGCIPDISSFQTNVDFDKLCNNSDFVIIRARFCTKTDATFEKRAQELNNRNMPFAVYDYATLMSHGNAKQQAEAIFNLCNKYHPSVYYIDTEQLGTGVTRGNEMDYIKTYVNRLRELGVEKIGQYTGDWLYSTYYKRIQDLFDTLWIASYGSNNGTYDGVKLQSEQYTDKIDLHQFTDKGTLPGIATKGDLSRLTGKKPLSWFTGRSYKQN